MTTQTSLVQLKPVQKNDSDFLLQIRNDPTSYSQFKNATPVSPHEHKQWFQSQLQKSDPMIHVAWLGENRIGSVRMDSNNIISVNLHADYRGKGHGTTVLRLAVDHFFQVNKAPFIIAHIKKNNTASIQAFQKAGFVFESEEDEFVHLKIKSN